MQKRVRSLMVVVFLLLAGADLYAAPKRGKDNFWFKFRSAAAQFVTACGDVLGVPDPGK